MSHFPTTALVEVTVISPVQHQRVRAAARTPLAAARHAEESKWDKYSKLASEAGRHLFIAAFESTGTFGKGVNEVLKACSALVSYESFNE